MSRCWYGAILLTTLSLHGCFLWDQNDPSRRNQVTNVPANLPPASEAVSSRAYAVFTELLAANPDIAAQLAPPGATNFQPTIQVYGLPEVSIFHRGGGQLIITEGLINRCTTDGKDLKNEGALAAVLASELSKMVIEADAQKSLRNPTDPGPLVPKMSGENRNPDGTDLATVAQWEKDNPRRRDPARASINQDPRTLTKNYLSKANFSPDEVNKVSSLLRQAERSELEKQMNPPKDSGWGLDFLTK